MLMTAPFPSHVSILEAGGEKGRSGSAFAALTSPDLSFLSPRKRVKITYSFEFLERFGVRCVFVDVDDAW